MKKRKPHILPTAICLVHMLTTTHAAQPAEAYADFTEDGTWGWFSAPEKGSGCYIDTLRY